MTPKGDGMKSGLAVAALGISLLGAALAGCGSQDGSLVGYTPEGQPSNAVLLTDVTPDTRLTVVFTDTLTNTGDSLDTFEITAAAGAFPEGTVFGLFRNDGVTPLPDTDGNHLVDTGPIGAGAQVLIQLHATLPGGASGGPYNLDLTAGSVRDPSKTATAVNVLGEVYPAARTLPTDAAPPADPLGQAIARASTANSGFGSITVRLGAAPKQVDATSALTFHGQTIEQAWPTFSDKLLVTGLIVDNTVADGFRIYANPAEQGFRPAEDFIAAASANWSTGWSFFSIRLATFDPAAGTDLVGRGAVDGIESGAAPITEHSYLPIATPAELVHRENVELISPADSAETDSTPVMSWAPTPGASRYLVQIFGRNGLQYLALTDQTSHQVQGTSGIIFQELPLRDGQFFRWDVYAVDSRNRIMGYSRELRALLINTGD
jgi:hypothetical protein